MHSCRYDDDHAADGIATCQIINHSRAKLESRLPPMTPTTIKRSREATIAATATATAIAIPLEKIHIQYNSTQ